MQWISKFKIILLRAQPYKEIVPSLLRDESFNKLRICKPICRFLSDNDYILFLWLAFLFLHICPMISSYFIYPESGTSVCHLIPFISHSQWAYHKTVLFVQGPDTAVESNVVTENQVETYGLQLVLSKLLNYQEFIPEIKLWGWHSNNMVCVNCHFQPVHH